MKENGCKSIAESFRAMLLKLHLHICTPRGDLVKNGGSDLVGLGWSLKFCIFHKLAADADDAIPEPHLKKKLGNDSSFVSLLLYYCYSLFFFDMLIIQLKICRGLIQCIFNKKLRFYLEYHFKDKKAVHFV